MEMFEDKVYFSPGDVVTIKLEVPNKPIMIVDRKKSITMRGELDKTKVLQGIVCRWFTTTGEFQEALFSTKDLVKL